jgi:hypothetical protein
VRRVVYVIAGAVTVNLALMASMYLQILENEKCDISARGLVLWSEEDRTWWLIDEPEGPPTGQPPCRAKRSTELVVLPG